MSFIVCPALPFPNVFWWSHFTDRDTVLLVDGSEHFEKMTLRNRYIIAAADGPLTLSIPLTEGRQQRKPMKEVLICNKTKWQIQHWRTLESVYRRAPYFEHYEPELRPLFEQPFERLLDFNMATIGLLLKLQGAPQQLQLTDSYHAIYPDAAADLRKQCSSAKLPLSASAFPAYHQVFADRTGFLPNMSLLDLLFAAGPRVRQSLVTLPA